jgi:hypothetical protein
MVFVFQTVEKLAYELMLRLLPCLKSQGEFNYDSERLLASDYFVLIPPQDGGKITWDYSINSIPVYVHREEM